MVKEFCGGFLSPIGQIKITCSTDSILAVDFEESSFVASPNQIVDETMIQLREYFEGTRQEFDLPIVFSGTAFQLKTWNSLKKIPFGCTVSYKEQATMIGNHNASRAVGGANNKNKIAIIVPCHRVIGAKGDLIGYASGIGKKNWLIQHEKRIKNEKL